jgi:hypothetical protein
LVQIPIQTEAQAKRLQGFDESDLKLPDDDGGGIIPPHPPSSSSSTTYTTSISQTSPSSSQTLTTQPEACLRDTTAEAINKLLSDGGPQTRIILCQSTTIKLNHRIIFTAKDQEISTQGYPEEEKKKARLLLVGGRRGTAVQ